MSKMEELFFKVGQADALIYGNQLEVRIAELERRNARLVDAAEQVCKKLEHPTASVTSIDMWNLREALDATSADTEKWLRAEIVKRLGEPVAWMREYPVARYEIFVGDGWRYAQGFVTKLYRLPSPLATPEERKE